MKQILNRILHAMIPFLLLAGMTACRSTAADGDTPEEARQKKMCAEVLNAIGENDYKSFQCVCGDLVPEKEFRSAHSSMKHHYEPVGTDVLYRIKAIIQLIENFRLRKFTINFAFGES